VCTCACAGVCLYVCEYVCVHVQVSVQVCVCVCMSVVGAIGQCRLLLLLYVSSAIESVCVSAPPVPAGSGLQPYFIVYQSPVIVCGHCIGSPLGYIPVFSKISIFGPKMGHV
jgi:hypothetical protein